MKVVKKLLTVALLGVAIAGAFMFGSELVGAGQMIQHKGGTCDDSKPNPC